MSATSVLLLAGILSSGLMAGLFFGWAVSVIPGLARIADRSYVSTMQSVNRAIVNPLFVVFFIGTVVALAAGALVHLRDGQTRRATWLAAAAGAYAFGVLGVTVGRNIPLNDALDAFALDGATDEAVAERRRGYESPWNRWHNVRTAANAAAFSFASTAALIADPD